MIVEVKPLPKEKPWHGVTDPEKSFTRTKVYEVYYNAENGKYDTGLTEEEKKKFEKELGIDLSDRFIANEPHPFFSTRQGQIILEPNTMFFNTENSLQALKLKFMEACDFVANSLKDWEDGKFPYATHYIKNISDETKAKATKVSTRNQCIGLLLNMSLEEKVSLARILSDEPLRDRSENTVAVALDEVIENQPEEFFKYAKMNKDEMYIRATLLEALDKNILIKQGLTISFNGETIADDFESLVSDFRDPKHQATKLKVFEKLDASKKI